MGFLNFFKKKEGKKVNLEIPPPPPPSLQKPLPEFKKPKIEQIEPKFKPITPKLNIPEISFKPPHKPQINIPKTVMQPIRFKPSFPKPEFKHEEHKHEEHKHEEHIEEEPKIIPEKHITHKEIFVRTENFKHVVDNLNSIKKKIKESENALSRLNDVKNDEDKQYEKWHSQLEEVQRKLMFVDKMLFEVSKNG